MSFLFNTLSRFFIAILPRSNCLLISWLQSPSTVTLEPRKRKCHFFYLCPFYLPWSDGTGCHDLRFFFFLILSFKPAFLFSSFTFIKRLSSSSLLSSIREASYAHLRLWIFFLVTLIPAWNSPSLTFLMMCSPYKLNKQGDNIKPYCHTPFSILNQSAVPYKVLTVASWPPYMFLRRQERWSLISVSLGVFHSLLWFTQSKVLAQSLKQK